MAEQGEHPSRGRRRWPIYLLLSLVAVSVLLHTALSRRAKEIRRTRERYAALVRERPVEETKARRAHFYEVRFFLAYPQSVSFAAADFIRRVERVITPARLLAVQVDPDLHDLRFELTVGIEAASVEAARGEGAAFIDKLRMLPGIIEASCTPQERRGEWHVFAFNGRAERP